jgi:uncharacterized protein (DUF934 family)
MSAVEASRTVLHAGCTTGAIRFVEAGAPVDFTLGPDVDVETLEADVARHRSIALVFPKWTDGRAYSQARLLRVRYRFTGEIRATGEVLVDMLPLLARTGFDAAVLRADQSPQLAERARAFFADGHYQGDTIEPRPRFGRTNEATT